MSGRFLRIAILGAALLAAAASSSTRSETGAPGPAPGQPYHGGYQCHAIYSQGNASATQCFSTPERCQRERQAAQQQGLQGSLCADTTPVACFQLGGDANPSNEMCASSLEDCELWRRIDLQKNGSTGEPCAWKH